MKRIYLVGALCAGVLPLVSTLSHASLIDRGGGLIYDDVLDITWLQDTNFALTNGDNDGRMDWYQANAWADGLSYYDSVRNVTYDDWRLPGISPIDGISYNTASSNDGTTDQGYARTTTDGTDGGWRDIGGTPVSELGYMYYVNLANYGKCDENFTGCRTYTRVWGLQNTGPFINFSHIEIEEILGRYATGADYDDELAWNFNLITGEQILRPKGVGYDNLAAWAVRDGDVFGAVPVPAAVWLFGSGLVVLTGIAKKKGSKHLLRHHVT